MTSANFSTNGLRLPNSTAAQPGKTPSESRRPRSTSTATAAKSAGAALIQAVSPSTSPTSGARAATSLPIGCSQILGSSGLPATAVGPASGAMRESLRVYLTLPWPPSTNTLWRNVAIGGGQRTLLSAKARAFLEEAAKQVAVQRAGLRFKGAVMVTCWLHAPTRRSYDIDNRVKALLDAATHGGLWHDDGQVDVLLVQRGEVVNGGRARLVIEEIEA